MLYGNLHVQQALALVGADDAYSEVLQLESEPRVEGQGDEQPQVLQAAAPNPVLNATIIKSKGQHVEGEVPPHFPEQASYSSHASSSLCLDNQEQYSRLAQYKYSRGGYDCVPVAPDGSCLFSSLRRIISAPFEYRNIHPRRQLVVMLANHKEFFFFTDQEVQDHNCPGPFSFHSYLSALLNPKMWGDEQVLCLCSMMWQIGLTVVSAETFTQIRFRHRSSLEKADGVLVMCLGQHYVPACKYSSFVPLVRSPFQVITFVFIAFECGRMRSDGSIPQSDGCILRSDGCFRFLLINSILYLFQCVVLMEWTLQATSQLSLTV